MKILKYSFLIASIILLNACASVPVELQYQQPGLPLGSSSIQGMRKDNKGLLSADEILNIITIDGKYVDGYDGAYWGDKIAIYPGDHVVEVLYSYPDFLVGATLVRFTAQEYTHYQFKFQFPYGPSQQEKENFNREFNTDIGDGTPWARVWVEDLSTGDSQPHTLIPLHAVTTIPIIL